MTTREVGGGKWKERTVRCQKHFIVVHRVHACTMFCLRPKHRTTDTICQEVYKVDLEPTITPHKEPQRENKHIHNSYYIKAACQYVYYTLIYTYHQKDRSGLNPLQAILQSHGTATNSTMKYLSWATVELIYTSSKGFCVQARAPQPALTHCVGIEHSVCVSSQFHELQRQGDCKHSERPQVQLHHKSVTGKTTWLPSPKLPLKHTQKLH